MTNLEIYRELAKLSNTAYHRGYVVGITAFIERIPTPPPRKDVNHSYQEGFRDGASGFPAKNMGCIQATVKPGARYKALKAAESENLTLSEWLNKLIEENT